MAVVGDAYVVVRAITNRVRDDIQRAFRDARPALAQEGRAACEAYGGGFSDGIGSSRMGDSVNNALRDTERVPGRVMTGVPIQTMSQVVVPPL